MNNQFRAASRIATPMITPSTSPIADTTMATVPSRSPFCLPTTPSTMPAMPNPGGQKNSAMTPQTMPMIDSVLDPLDCSTTYPGTGGGGGVAAWPAWPYGAPYWAGAVSP